MILSNILKHSKADYVSKHKKFQLMKLSKLVQNQLDRLQNPPDCTKARKLVCNLEKACGFGCQMHHLSFCFTAAYHTNRTLVIVSHKWKYNPKGLNEYFLPVTKCNVDNEETDNWIDEEVQKKSQNVWLPVVDHINERAKFLPQAVPKNLLKELRFLHGSPFVWWIGQLLTYLLRFNSQVIDMIHKSERKINFTRPCVGVVNSFFN